MTAETEESSRREGRDTENIQQFSFWMSRLRWRDFQQDQQRIKIDWRLCLCVV